MKTSEICCEVCRRSDVALYRNGPKGQIVPWRCMAHIEPKYKPDDDVRKIANIIAAAPALGEGER